MPTRVLKTYAEPMSVEDDLAVRDQLRLAGRYHRALIESENLLRSQIKALEDVGPNVASRRQRMARWYGYESNEARRKKIIKAARERYKDSFAAAVGPVRDTEAYITGKDAAEEAAKQRAHDLRNALGPRGEGLGYGTYQFVEEAHDQASRTSRSWLSTIKTDVAFDEGAVAVHLQNAAVLTWAELTTGNNNCQLAATKHARSPLNKAGKVRPQRFQAVKMRIGRTPTGERLWVHFRVIVHRDVPPGAKVTWLRLHRERCGPRYRYSWQVVMTIEEDENHVAPAPAKYVGVDLGWRLRPDGGMRLAYAVGSDGAEHELVLPAKVINRRGKTESLQSIRKRVFNQLLEALRMWRDMTTDPWFLEATEHAHNWRSAKRLVGLVAQWRTHRYAGDDVGYVLFEAWNKHDRHLWAWEANNDRRMRLQIHKQIEEWGVMVAKRYQCIGIEKLNSREMSQGESDVAALMRKRVSLASPFLVHAKLKSAAVSRGRRVAEVNMANTSRKCSACGHLMTLTVAVNVACSACGAVHDRDRNAAINIMDRAKVKSLLPEVPRVPKKMRARRTRPGARSRARAAASAAGTSVNSP